MSYKALVAPARVRPHPNSDKGLKILNINGYQVITAADVQDGELMVFFEAGGVLAPEYLSANNEYRSKALLNANQQPILKRAGGRTTDAIIQELQAQPAGFFEENGRVRSIKLRGERSEGYAVRLNVLAYTGVDPTSFFAGQTFDELNGHKICWKYVSPATLRAQARLLKSGVKVRKLGLDMFHEHYDTENLRHGLNAIPDGARVIITEKLHGSSGRTGLVLVDQPPNLWARIKAYFGYATTPTQDWAVVTGTRKVVRWVGPADDLRPDLAGEDESVRREIHDSLGPCLHKGETFYYEIIGRWSNGAAIFTHGIPEDEVGKLIYKSYKDKIPPEWGHGFQYVYGHSGNSYSIYVYRITQTNIDGKTVEYSWEQIQSRCRALGLKVVPHVTQGYVHRVLRGRPDGTGQSDEVLVFYSQDTVSLEGEDLLPLLEKTSAHPSSLDPRHISEGVCLRIEHPDLQKTYKYKGFNFCHLEGIRKNSDDYIDPEEAA